MASTSALIVASVMVSIYRATSNRPSANAVISRIVLKEAPRPSYIARTIQGSPSTKRARKLISPIWLRDIIRARLRIVPTYCYKASTTRRRETSRLIRLGAPPI